MFCLRLLDLSSSALDSVDHWAVHKKKDAPDKLSRSGIMPIGASVAPTTASFVSRPAYNVAPAFSLCCHWYLCRRGPSFDRIFFLHAFQSIRFNSDLDLCGLSL